MENYTALPAPESVRLIDFEHAEVNGGFITDTFVLTVSGTKPYANMRVELSPRIYTHRPEYWGIEVIGFLPGGIGLPATAPYTVSIPLDGILGTKGIEVVGASSSQKIDVPGKSGKATEELCNERGDVSYRANQVPGAVIIIAEGMHGSPGFDVFFQQSSIDVFPPEFILYHRAPEGFVIQVETPFVTSTQFQAAEEVEYVTVNDAQGAQRIKVDQTPD